MKEIKIVQGWYKQWKIRRGCLEEFLSREVPRVIISDFPDGRSPKGKSDYPWDLLWANLPDNPNLPTVCQTLDFKYQRTWDPQLTHHSGLKPK